MIAHTKGVTSAAASFRADHESKHAREQELEEQQGIITTSPGIGSGRDDRGSETTDQRFNVRLISSLVGSEY
jgi:hypothetical protein